MPFSGITVTDKKLRENADEVKRLFARWSGRQFFLSHAANRWRSIGTVETFEIDRRERLHALDQTVSRRRARIARSKTNRLDQADYGKDVKPEDVIDFTLCGRYGGSEMTKPRPKKEWPRIHREH